ncbi:MAG: Kelch repeat-containing protein [Gaiellaceae bacterium]
MSVWTGRQLIVFGRAHRNPPWSVDVSAEYNPAAGTWRRLTPFPGDRGSYEGHYSAVWTGREMLVFGPFDFQAFNPLTDRWRRLPRSLPSEFALGLVVWTGREAIAWGGGCCGDASSTGWAYDPATGKVRKLARSVLAPSQGPVGAWTGRELIVFVSGFDPDGKPYPASLARAAAYNPTTNTWRRIAPLPAPRDGPAVVWDGHDVLIVGGTVTSRTAQPRRLARTGFAYEPASNRWRQLAPMGSGRASFAAVWAGTRLLIWGGTTIPGGGAREVVPQSPPQGFAYDPATNRWSALSRAPLRGCLEPTAVWTGHAMIVWGGSGLPNYQGFTDGARFTPATR